MKKTLFTLLTCFCALTIKAGILVTTVADSTVKSTTPVEGKNSFEIDFNQDGTTDIVISSRFFLKHDGPHPPYNCFVVEVDSTNQNGVNCGPFLSGAAIDSSLSYDIYRDIYGYIPGLGGVGRWDSRIEDIDTFAYIGVKFYINNNIHYGWIKLKTDALSFTVNSYAYNNIAGQQILAGQLE